MGIYQESLLEVITTDFLHTILASIFQNIGYKLSYIFVLSDRPSDSHAYLQDIYITHEDRIKEILEK